MLEKTEWSIQRHWQHWVRKSQDEEKTKTQHNNTCTIIALINAGEIK
jgi:hypothetical protein